MFGYVIYNSDPGTDTSSTNTIQAGNIRTAKQLKHQLSIQEQTCTI